MIRVCLTMISPKLLTKNSTKPTKLRSRVLPFASRYVRIPMVIKAQGWYTMVSTLVG